MTDKKIMDAITYAAKKHDGQKRKADGTPYIIHPYRVAMRLKAAGLQDHVVIAGLLHDVVEDTDCTLDEISTLFGHKVAELVGIASEPDKSAAWEERKKHTIETVKSAPIEAKLVVCADKIDNLQSILDNESTLGKEMWQSFKRGRESQQWYYQNIYQSLVYDIDVEEYHELFTELKSLLDQFLR
ncbi:phosphohydrolase [Paraliobacillus quinghaiensis]|uniref:Phosphohydrolase n=1 Tax=Paraliobacillus quinghaiensis TaxID=470815 RepID=A0A917TR45_9BACI|nr:HD domain-containing protein [Paraliobacillus quinghaiensis]GGM34214.1 phosphohydrolase [Paraliobacillus quinghaiensis]